jgi:uncharacterized protein YcbX
MKLSLTQINIYPIKSLGGISLQSAAVEKRGLKYDRRWMLINDKKMFMTQREYPQMALLQVDFHADGLIINHKIENVEPISIPFEITNAKKIEVPIWDNLCEANTANEEINEWFSENLRVKCSLVYMSDDAERKVDPRFDIGNNIVSFADAYPFLIIGEESLNDLNSRLTEKLPMNRFRPNFVFSGGYPFIEDTWKKFKIGDLVFYAVKPCSRCAVTTVNQETSERSKEPLAILSSYRQINNKVLFGQNLVHESTGKVEVGDELNILETKESPFVQIQNEY